VAVWALLQRVHTSWRKLLNEILANKQGSAAHTVINTLLFSAGSSASMHAQVSKTVAAVDRAHATATVEGVRDVATLLDLVALVFLVALLLLLLLTAVCRQMMAAVACRWQPVSASRMPWRCTQQQQQQQQQAWAMHCHLL
jgi:hypothetical protein